jgi:hypothetical protein
VVAEEGLSQTNTMGRVGGVGDLILIEAILIKFCISIKIYLILIEMMRMLFDPTELYSNRSTGIHFDYYTVEPNRNDVIR